MNVQTSLSASRVRLSKLTMYYDMIVNKGKMQEEEEEERWEVEKEEGEER